MEFHHGWLQCKLQNLMQTNHRIQRNLAFAEQDDNILSLQRYLSGHGTTFSVNEMNNINQQYPYTPSTSTRNHHLSMNMDNPMNNINQQNPYTPCTSTRNHHLQTNMQPTHHHLPTNMANAMNPHQHLNPNTSSNPPASANAMNTHHHLPTNMANATNTHHHLPTNMGNAMNTHHHSPTHMANATNTHHHLPTNMSNTMNPHQRLNLNTSSNPPTPKAMEDTAVSNVHSVMKRNKMDELLGNDETRAKFDSWLRQDFVKRSCQAISAMNQDQSVFYALLLQNNLIFVTPTPSPIPPTEPSSTPPNHHPNHPPKNQVKKQTRNQFKSSSRNKLNDKRKSNPKLNTHTIPSTFKYIKLKSDQSYEC